MKKLLLALLLLSAIPAVAQNTGELLPPAIPTFLNALGTAPTSLGFVCTTASGGSTPLATYQDTALTSANQNPIRLSVAGRPINGSNEVRVYLQAASYRISLYTAGTGNTCNGLAVGTLIRQVDGVYNLAQLFTLSFATKLDDKVCHASQYAGATEDLKYTACIAALPSTGGTIDGRGLEGAQTWAACPWTGVTKSITVILGAGTHTVSVTCAPGINIGFNFTDGSILSPIVATTLTINGAIDAPLSTIFAGAGTVVTPGVQAVYPQWWGMAVATSDSGPALNSAVLAVACNGKIVIPPGTYTFATQWAIYKTGSQCKFTIDGTANFATKLTWNGSTAGTAIVIQRAIRFNVANFEVLNGVAKGTTVGLLVRSENTGSDTGPGYFLNVSVVGFHFGLQIGLSSNESASELNIQNLEGTNNDTAVVVNGSQTLNLSFGMILFASNTTGMDVVNGGFVTVNSGSASNSTNDFIFRTQATHFTVKHFRSENVGTRFVDVINASATQITWVDIEDCEMRPAAGSITMIAGSGAIFWKIKNNTIVGTVSPGVGAQFIEFTGNGVLGGGSNGLPFTDDNETDMQYTQSGNYTLTSASDWGISSRFNNSNGKIVATVKTDILMWNVNGILVNGGVNQAGTGIQHKRGSVGCTTGGAAIGDACTSGALSWTTAFPDTNYTLVCTLGDSELNTGTITKTVRSAGSFTITIAQLTASATTADYSCVGIHD